jgi:hydroxyacylglutathione hydrolase
LYSSLQRLQSLPQKTKIYCAHEYTRNNLAFARTIEPQNHYLLTLIEELQKHPATCTLPSTIEREQEINPFFRIHLPSIQQYAKEKGHTSQDPFSLFTLLREEKNLW